MYAHFCAFCAAFYKENCCKIQQKIKHTSNYVWQNIDSPCHWFSTHNHRQLFTPKHQVHWCYVNFTTQHKNHSSTNKHIPWAGENAVSLSEIRHNQQNNTNHKHNNKPKQQQEGGFGREGPTAKTTPLCDEIRKSSQQKRAWTEPNP